MIMMLPTGIVPRANKGSTGSPKLGTLASGLTSAFVALNKVTGLAVDTPLYCFTYIQSQVVLHV